MYGRIDAASHEILVAGDSAWYGSAVVRTATIDESVFAVDVGSLGTTLNDDSRVEVLATWKSDT